jgi:hypothetical protein
MYRSIISVFLCKPNLSLIFLRWLSTVWREIHSLSAISFSDEPLAKEVLECYEGTLKYYNFLTENEAEEIVAAFQNQDGSKGPKWRDPDELFEKVEQHDGRVECEPYYNKWALYVAMNKAASDQNSVILKWIGDDKDKYIIACYDLALTDLKDKDRPYWIRKYFHVESKF